jgi:hypothetical protein
MMRSVDDPIGGGWRAERVAFYLAAYASWLVAAALSAVVGAYWHWLALNLYIGMRLDKWAFQMFGTWLALGLIVGWLVLVVFLEHWLSHAGTLARLRGRVARVLIPGAVALAASYLAATYLMTRYV